MDSQNICFNVNYGPFPLIFLLVKLPSTIHLANKFCLLPYSHPRKKNPLRRDEFIFICIWCYGMEKNAQENIFFSNAISFSPPTHSMSNRCLGFTWRTFSIFEWKSVTKTTKFRSNDLQEKSFHLSATFESFLFLLLLVCSCVKKAFKNSHHAK